MSSSTFGYRSMAQLMYLCPMHSTRPMLQTKFPELSIEVPAAGTGLGIKQKHLALLRSIPNSSAGAHLKSIEFRNLYNTLS